MGYKIAEARKAKGWNQQKLAEMMGTTQQQIARWETGQRDPKADVVIKLSALLGVTVSYLLGVDDDSAFVEAVPARSYDVPVVGKIAAGAAREAIEQAGEYMQTTEYMYNRHPNAFWLVVSGNSMNRLFPDGALVLIDPDEDVRNGDVAALFVNGDDATIKRVEAIRYCIIQAASLKCDDSDALDGAVSMMFDTIQAHDGGREGRPVRHRCGVEHRPPQPAHA